MRLEFYSWVGNMSTSVWLAAILDWTTHNESAPFASLRHQLVKFDLVDKLLSMSMIVLHLSSGCHLTETSVWASYTVAE